MLSLGDVRCTIRKNGKKSMRLARVTNLRVLRLNGNQFIDLPDLSSIMTLTDLLIQDNKFTFEDIEPNIGVATFIYAPQDSVGTKQDTTVTAGSSLTVSVVVGGANNQYQWLKDGTEITEATESSYTIDSVEDSDAGAYICKITNTVATALTLYSRPIDVTVSGATGISDNSSQIPKAFALYQNYPNPFNPSTTIKYDLPRGSNVVLKIYNMLGQEIRTLINKHQTVGYKSLTWDGKDNLGQLVSSGIYIYRLQAGTEIQSNNMLFLK